MILVTGGIASGKRTYARNLGYGDKQMSSSLASDAPVLFGLEELLRQGPLSEQDLQVVRAKDVVICCEVGLGVVPIDADERAWRELVGRTCSQLAAEAQQVVRMVCGIPLQLR